MNRNQKHGVITLEECKLECKKYSLCKWFNWFDNTASRSSDRNTCWLKINRGSSYDKIAKEGAVTGHRDSIEECPHGDMFLPVEVTR